jgi:hypothetical protein
MTRLRLVGVVLGSAIYVVLALGAGPPGPGGDERKAPAPGGKAAEKRIAFQMRAAPWKKVFEWLADVTGLPVVAGEVPTGTFTFIAPAGGNQRNLTIPEVIDAVNEGLLAKRYLLIRHQGSLKLVSADDPLPATLAPLIKPNELAGRGKTEVVRLVLPVGAAHAKETLGAVKSLLGPFGQALPVGERLLVRDTVANLRQVVRFLEEVRPAKAQPAGALVPGFAAIEVGGDAATLAELLERDLRAFRANPVRVIVPGKPKKGAKPPAAGKGPPPVTLVAAGDRLLVACDDPQVVALVQQLARLGCILPQGNATVIRLRHGNAVAAARVLEEVLNGRSAQEGKRTERARIVADANSNALIVRASALDMAIIKSLLTQTLDMPSARAEGGGVQTWFLGPLRHARAGDFAKVLREVYQDSKKATVTIAVDPRTNAVILRGPVSVYEDARKLVERLDVRVEKKE